MLGSSQEDEAEEKEKKLSNLRLSAAASRS